MWISKKYGGKQKTDVDFKAKRDYFENRCDCKEI